MATEEKKVETVNPSWNKYYVAPEDGPCLYDIYEPLNAEMFKKPPVDILNLTLPDVLGNKFISFRGSTEREKEESGQTEEVNCDYFDGVRFVGLFFSAGFSSPCKIMMKTLKNFYSDINLEQRQFEVLQVPFDRTKQEWEEHYRSVCWPSLIWGDARIKQLAEKYEITGVPQLIILDTKTGFCISKSARKDILEATKSEEAVKEVF
jgi:thiol-disulfide isomerase/thioredoxin